MSIMVAATPELVRVLRRSPRRFRRFVSLLALSQASLAAVWGAAALLAPDPVGRALFGETWPNAQPLLLLLAIGQLGIGFRVGPMAGLRALGAAKRTLKARGVVTAMVFVVTTVSAALDGARGVALATAVVNPVQAAVWWYHFGRAMADHRRTGDAAVPDGTDPDATDAGQTDPDAAAADTAPDRDAAPRAGGTT